MRIGEVDNGLSVPSPWVGAFDSVDSYLSSAPNREALWRAYSYLDDHLLTSRRPMVFPAVCVGCGSLQSMRFDWWLGAITPQGEVHTSWTETCACERCGLNSRLRAVLAFVLGHKAYSPKRRCLLTERVTNAFGVYGRYFEHLTGTEYLGPQYQPGQQVAVPSAAAIVRHEDLTKLSFGDGSFDTIVSQDVFEHIPDYRAAFAECARVLSPNGHLVFSIPFHGGASKTQIGAVLTAHGEIQHIMPREVHGNPVAEEGSLCFQNFGWDILDDLRLAGFARAAAHMYWGPWLGHIGQNCFVFCAEK